MGTIYRNGVPFAGVTPTALSVSYDDSTSGLNAGNVQAAIDNLDEKVDDNTSDISTAESNITSLTSRVSTAESDISTAESNITSLTSRVSTAESNITSLTSRVSTAESNITSLTSRVSTAERNIVSIKDWTNGSGISAKTGLSVNSSRITKLAGNNIVYIRISATLSSTKTAGSALVQITNADYKPAVNVPIVIFNSNQNLGYKGVMKTDGNIYTLEAISASPVILEFSIFFFKG